MGQVFTRALDQLAWLFSGREVKIFMLGLDSAGKTTVLYQLKLGEKVTTIPTIGINVEVFQYKNVEFTLWDVNGDMHNPRHRMFGLMRHYFSGMQGVVFVVDSADRGRIEEARDAMQFVLNDGLENVPLLILANKNDLPETISAAELTEKLELPKLSPRPWFLQSCCADTGEGLYEGLDWLSANLSSALKNSG